MLLVSLPNPYQVPRDSVPALSRGRHDGVLQRGDTTGATTGEEQRENDAK